MTGDERGVCIIGRSSLGTGIGSISLAWAELLSRSYDVSLYDVAGPTADPLALPSGREIARTPSLDGFSAYVHCDILWNGVATASVVAPASGFRIAHIAFDSDQLPVEWVRLLNEHFDLVLLSSSHLVDTARESGVQIDIGVAPIALDVDAQLSEPYRPAPGPRVRFGTVSAFHPRKGLETLVEAFLSEFGCANDAELLIHSNLAIGPTIEALRRIVDRSSCRNVVLSTEDLTDAEKTQLISTFDVYVAASQGEGYSIGPREALAQGKVVVATDLGAHQDLFDADGVFRVPVGAPVPALYPEIDNRQFGYQTPIDHRSLGQTLREASRYATGPEAQETAPARKLLASRWSMQRLENAYRAVVDPDAVVFGADRPVEEVQVPQSSVEKARRRAGRFGSRLGSRRIVIPLHDGGFFSLFNTYVSHLTWSLADSPRRLVVPDWRAEDLLRRCPDPTSYCYSRPDEGSLWNALFEPPFGLSRDDLEDPAFLADGAQNPVERYNEHREPNLTYINAYRLYHDPDLLMVRRQYAQALREHVRPVPALRREIDSFVEERLDGRFVIAAHVKHPSHAVEQPDGRIAHRSAYVDHVREQLTARGIAEGSDDWRVFLATEQERVIDLFFSEFGEHTVVFPQVERIPSATDEAFDQLADEEKTRDGHQLQHIVAADTSRWSTRLAWEVYRDAAVMSAADVLLHAVSNVATAASFMNPESRMVFVAP